MKKKVDNRTTSEKIADSNRNRSKRLTIKQKKFVAEVIKSGNGTQAAIKAGYSKNSAQEIASENLSKPIIQAEIKSIADKLGINAEYVLQNFKEIADFNKQKVIKTAIKGTIEIQTEEMIDASAAIKANELLGKHLSLFVEKVKHEGEINLIHNFDQNSSKKLQEILEKAKNGQTQ